MKNKRIILLVLSIVTVLILFVGCSQQSTVSQKPSEQAAAQASVQPSQSAVSSSTVTPQKSYKIGVCAADLSNPYFIKLVNGIQDEAKQIGNVDVIVTDPKQDASKQADAIENFISLKVDAIVIVAFQPESVETYLKEAMGKGIKVLAQSTKCNNCDVYVSAKDADMGYALGVAAGQYIKSTMNGTANVAILDYPDIPQIIDRENGIKKGITENAPNAQIVASAKAGTPDEGMSATETILQAHKDINVICAINDAGALGAYNAVEAAGKANGNFFIGGIDADDQALAKIKEGGIYKATVDTQPYDNGKMDMDTVIKLLNGENVDKEIQVQVKAITAANLK